MTHHFFTVQKSYKIHRSILLHTTPLNKSLLFVTVAMLDEFFVKQLYTIIATGFLHSTVFSPK